MNILDVQILFFVDTINEKNEHITQLEKKYSETSQLLDTTTRNYTGLKIDYSVLEKQLKALQDQMETRKSHLDVITQLETRYCFQHEVFIYFFNRVNDLTEETIELRKLLSEKETHDHAEESQLITTSRQLETLRELSEELTSSRKEVAKLYSEIDSYRSQAEGINLLNVSLCILFRNIASKLGDYCVIWKNKNSESYNR